MVQVKNINGTSDRKPKGFDSWKEFWESNKNSKFGSCSNLFCSKNAEVGGHVIKTSESAKDYWYIVPLCKTCNKLTTEFYVFDDKLARVTNNN